MVKLHTPELQKVWGGGGGGGGGNVTITPHLPSLRVGWTGGAGKGEQVQEGARQGRGGRVGGGTTRQISVHEGGKFALTSLTAASMSSMDGPLMSSSV